MSGIKGRPRGRPFAKRQSGNPGGRPIKPVTIAQRKLIHDVRLFARDHGAEAVGKLVAVMRGVVTVEIGGEPIEMLVPPVTHLAAAIAVLDRGYGRPHQSVELYGGDFRAEEQEGSALEIMEAKLAAMSDRRREVGHPLRVEP